MPFLLLINQITVSAFFLIRNCPRHLLCIPVKRLENFLILHI